MDQKPKHVIDAELDEALKETFPASDAASSNEVDERPVRPVHRKPPRIDKGLVDDLAGEAERKTRRAAGKQAER